jgi:hypothetical protein
MKTLKYGHKARRMYPPEKVTKESLKPKKLVASISDITKGHNIVTLNIDKPT